MTISIDPGDRYLNALGAELVNAQENEAHWLWAVKGAIDRMCEDYPEPGEDQDRAQRQVDRMRLGYSRAQARTHHCRQAIDDQQRRNHADYETRLAARPEDFAPASRRVRYCTFHETVHADQNHESAVCKIVLKHISRKPLTD